MKHLYTFAIAGMTCHACEKLITMDLAEAGFTPQSIDHQSGQLIIEIDPADVDAVKQAVQASKTYTIADAYTVADVTLIN